MLEATCIDGHHSRRSNERVINRKGQVRQKGALRDWELLSEADSSERKPLWAKNPLSTVTRADLSQSGHYRHRWTINVHVTKQIINKA